MICLLCGQHLKKNLTFGELLFLKKEEGSLCLACYSSFEMIGGEHCPNCYKKGVSISCQDCQLWCKEGIDVSQKVCATILSENLKKYKGYEFVLIP